MNKMSEPEDLETKPKGFMDTVIEKGWKIQKGVDTDELRKYKYPKKFIDWYRSIARVFPVARKPNYDEFMKTSTISGAGILIIGAIGFAVYLLYKYVPIWLNL